MDAFAVSPGVAAVVDDILVKFEDAVEEPAAPHELPDVFDRVEFGRFKRQWQNDDVFGNNKQRKRCTHRQPPVCARDTDSSHFGNTESHA